MNGVCVIGFNHESVVALLRPKRSSGNISEHDAVRMKVCNPDDFDAVETEKIRKSAVSVGSKSVLTPSPRHNSDANSLLSRRLQYTPKYSEHDSVEERLSSTQEQITNLLVIFDMLRKNDGLTQRGEAMLVDAGVIQLLNGIVSSVDSNSGGAVVINRISNESTHTDGDAPSEAPSATVNSSPSKPSRIRHANSELQDKSRVSEGAAQTHLKKTSRSPTRLASQKHLVRNTREGGTAIITNAHSSHDRDNTAITAANERRRISGPQYMQKFEPKKSKRVPTSISSKTAWPIDGRRAKMPKESKKNSQQNASVIGLQVVQLHDVVPMSPSSVTHDGESIADSGRAEGNSQADSSSSRTYKDFVRNTHDAPDEWKKQSSPRQTQTNVMDGAVFTDPIYKMKSIVSFLQTLFLFLTIFPLFIVSYYVHCCARFYVYFRELRELWKVTERCYSAMHASAVIFVI